MIKIGSFKKKLVPPSPLHYDKFGGEVNISSWISQKDESYDFESLNDLLSNQKIKFRTFKNNSSTPPFNSRYGIYGGELNISSWIR